MAGVHAIRSVGESIRVFLLASYPADLAAAFPCTFQVLSSGQLARFEDPTESTVTVTLYLYRVTVCEHPRNGRSGHSSSVPDRSLPLELHWLMTVWSASPAAEHAVFAWAMRELHARPLLDASTLTADGEWGASETVQVIPEELPIESMMRIWDALDPSYRLSASYVARIVRVDPPARTAPLPVLAVRLGVGQEEG